MTKEGEAKIIAILENILKRLNDISQSVDDISQSVDDFVFEDIEQKQQIDTVDPLT